MWSPEQNLLFINSSSNASEYRRLAQAVAGEDAALIRGNERFADSIRYVQSYPTELAMLRDVLPHIQTPVQIICGLRDEVVPLVNAEYLDQRLPNSEPHVVDAGHFIWEDATDDYAALVREWWAGGFKRCMK